MPRATDFAARSVGPHSMAERELSDAKAGPYGDWSEGMDGTTFLFVLGVAAAAAIAGTTLIWIHNH